MRLRVAGLEDHVAQALLVREDAPVRAAAPPHRCRGRAPPGRAGPRAWSWRRSRSRCRARSRRDGSARPRRGRCRSRRRSRRSGRRPRRGPARSSRRLGRAWAARARRSSTLQWSPACSPYLAAARRPPGPTRKSAGRPRRPPSGRDFGAFGRPRASRQVSTVTERRIVHHTRGSSSARRADSTPNSAYSRFSGSPIAANGRSATCSRSSSADEWNTTTSRIPAASISACRTVNERRCRLQIGQPANRRNCRWTSGPGGHGECRAVDRGQFACRDVGAGCETHGVLP